jgi:hypothetical protein
MAQGPFRFRNVQVVVDTTQTAEFDIALYSVTETELDVIATSLRKHPFLKGDRSVGDFHIRLIAGYDVVYIVGREARDVVVTIGCILPPDPSNPTEVILQKLEVLAIFRGAAGI